MSNSLTLARLTDQGQASEDEMKECDDRMLQSPRGVVAEVLETAVVHEWPRGIVHTVPL